MSGRPDPGSSTLRVVVVDDEPLARENLRALLRRDPSVEVVAESADGRGAIADIEAHHPDVVFLDIAMPDLTGFEVLRLVDVPVPPRVVFVTAYDEHALHAFEVNALDYLLKPVDDERFARTLARIRSGGGGIPPAKLEEAARTSGLGATGRIPVRDGRGVVLVEPSEVTHATTAGNYVTLHLASRTLLHRRALADLERDLRDHGFVRVHRTALVNASAVREIRSARRGDAIVVLGDGTELRLSRRYRAALDAIR